LVIQVPIVDVVLPPFSMFKTNVCYEWLLDKCLPCVFVLQIVRTAPFKLLLFLLIDSDIHVLFFIER